MRENFEGGVSKCWDEDELPPRLTTACPDPQSARPSSGRFYRSGVPRRRLTPGVSRFAVKSDEQFQNRGK